MPKKHLPRCGCIATVRHPTSRAILFVPKGIELKELPSYSPELNPAERFFEELRVVLANIVFESMEAMEDKLTEILQKYWENPKLLQRLTAFPWIRQHQDKQKRKQAIEH